MILKISQSTNQNQNQTRNQIRKHSLEQEGKEGREEEGQTGQSYVKCQHGNVRGGNSRLTTLIQHQVVLVAELLRSTRHENVLVTKEVL